MKTDLRSKCVSGLSTVSGMLLCLIIIAGCTDSLERIPIYESIKRSARIEESLCSQCGTCLGVCPQKAISFVDIENGKAYIIDPEKCNSCGECLKACPEKAIQYTDASIP